MGLLNFFETHIVGSDTRTEVTEKPSRGVIFRVQKVANIGLGLFVELFGG